MGSARSTSAVCKDIRDSAERAVDVTGRLKNLRLETTDWKSVLGPRTDGSNKIHGPAVREWRGILRELEGHFMTVRDQVFTITAQADIRPYFLEDLSDAVDTAATNLHRVFDEFQTRNGPPKTGQLVQQTIRLSRYSEKIQEALQKFIDELHEQTGARPLSRQDSNNPTPPPMISQGPKKLRITNLFSWERRSSSMNNRAQDARRKEQNATPSSFDSSGSSRRASDIAHNYLDSPLMKCDSPIEHIDNSIAVPIKTILESSELAGDLTQPISKTDSPTRSPPCPLPQLGSGSMEISFLNDMTVLTKSSITDVAHTGKRNPPNTPGASKDVQNKSNAVTTTGKLATQKRNKEHANRGRAGDASGGNDNDWASGQGDASDWDLMSRESFPMLQGEDPAPTLQPQPTFRNSMGNEKSKYVSRWILQSQAPPPIIPLPPLPGVVNAGVDGEASKAASAEKLGSAVSDNVSLHLILPELKFPSISFSDLTTSECDDLPTLATDSPKPTSNKSTIDEQPTDFQTRAVKTVNPINTGSSQALPIQTQQTLTCVAASTIPSADIFASLDLHDSITPHTYYPEGFIPPYQHIRQLGQGSLGMVDEVSLAVHHPNRSRIQTHHSIPTSSDTTVVHEPAINPSYPPTVTLARKSIRLCSTARTTTLDIIRTEIRALHALSHSHIVKLAGTYEDRRFYALLMSPVGDRNLRDFLEDLPDRPHSVKSIESTWLKSWFVCLASALAYIHSKGIRHEDIKPSNIIHRGPEIFLTDFSSAMAFEPGMTTSTNTPAGRITRVYSAPEALENKRHGRATDIFSMGCVFAEMAAVGITSGRVGGAGGFWEHCLIGPMGAENNRREWYCRALDRIDDWFLCEKIWKNRHLAGRMVPEETTTPLKKIHERGKSADAIHLPRDLLSPRSFASADNTPYPTSACSDTDPDLFPNDEERWTRGKTTVFYRECIRPMLSVDRKKRLTADVVTNRMRDWFGDLCKKTGSTCNCSEAHLRLQEANSKGDTTDG